METRKEGWLHKNHAGEPFAKDSQRRWFETVGFTVCYFRLPDKKSLKGHFDLRNVISIAPISDAEDIKAAGADAVAFSVSEEGKAPKTMILAFKVEGSADREGWLKLWCSAITADAVDAKLKQYIDPELSKLLNDKFANQEAVSRQRSLFGSKVSYTKVLTPRQSSDAIAQHQTGGSSALDTPRGDQLPAPAPLPPPAKEDDVPTTFEITVPDGVKPGDRLQATTPSGTKVKLVVPEGAEPGMLLTFQVPKGAGKKKKPKPDVDPAQEKSAIAIQKRLRGMNTRKQVRPTPPPVAKPEMVDNAAADQELSKAAMKLQAHYRGLATRNEQQESARLQWLQYYVETEEWEQALGLAVTPDEEAVIEKARKMAKPPASEEELRRQKWLKYYLNNGKFDKAAEIITSPLESAMFIKAKALRATRCFACLPRAEIEKERQERFIAAVRGYVWDQAEVLALTAEEMQDVHDSKVRVAHFEQALEDHKLDEAQQLAITDAEEARVAKAIAAQGGTANGHHHVSEMQISIPVSKETQAAALKVQAIVRGHQARDHQEEAASGMAALLCRRGAARRGAEVVHPAGRDDGHQALTGGRQGRLGGPRRRHCRVAAAQARALPGAQAGIQGGPGAHGVTTHAPQADPGPAGGHVGPVH